MKDLEPGKPDFNYLPFKVHNDVIYLAGQLAKENGIVKNKGRVLEDISEIEACRQIRICAEHAFTWIKIAVNNDNAKIDNILDLKVYIACNKTYDGISRLADKASEVFIEKLGEKGKHPRSVIAVERLPQNAPVMIDLRAVINLK
ncbi:RidA family protein [Alphaproteobacteria bacterium]|jgi:enamine deaminase RidA (YjgF/YER057c/UK114 family)|nr:RidA family protein [Alphaproteobacteria bacterium]|tara:strand:+ start:3898 stop:4332 length:435 start_codon:yes stop_codon:yes gene_type:complete